jgi:cation:H+ antiporter
MFMFLHTLGALLALAVILAGCELFTNAIEWLGRRYELSEGAVGSVLAAVGTALPETAVPLVALIWGKGADQADIGMGAILGAPFMLATLGLALNGGAALFYTKRGRRETSELKVNPHALRTDLLFFAPIYCAALLLGFGAPHWVRIVAAIAFLLAYAVHVSIHMRRPYEGDESELERLHAGALGQWLTYWWQGFRGKTDRVETLWHETEHILLIGHYDPQAPRTKLVLLQLIISLALIVGGAKLFVMNLNVVALQLGVSALMLSLVLTPIATELPEKMNSVLWVRADKDTLALGNITGAMVFQSCIPVSIGLLLTPWRLEPRGMVSAVVALVASQIVQVWMMKRDRLSPWMLMLGLPMYVIWFVLATTVLK